MKSKSDLKKLIAEFEKVKVLVVGDIMLDQYLWGRVERISPEAPVPVVKVEKTSLAVGGAANVAANVAGLGAEVFLAGVVGDDEEGRQVKRNITEAGICADYVLKIKSSPTIIKTRVVAHSQHVVRIDREYPLVLNKKEENKLLSLITTLIDKSDVLLISDYSKGLLSEKFLKETIAAAKLKKLPVVVDPKGRNFSKYKGAAILTPNKKEALDAAGITDNTEDSLKIAGQKLLKEADLEALLITRGDEGMTLFDNRNKTFDFKASARHVYDVTGAGDTVTAVLGVALGAKADLRTASEAANIAAGYVVEEVGTTVITRKKLLENFV